MDYPLEAAAGTAEGIVMTRKELKNKMRIAFKKLKLNPPSSEEYCTPIIFTTQEEKAKHKKTMEDKWTETK